MNLVPTWQLAARTLAACTVIVLVAGCSAAYQLHAPAGVLVGEAPGLHDPEAFSVDSREYRVLGATADFQPPKPQYRGIVLGPVARIQMTDRWLTTHKIGETLVLHSSEFQRRQCEFLINQGKNSGAVTSLRGTCQADYLYYIVTGSTGKASGWLRLKNPERVLSRSDRFTNMSVAPRLDSAWENMPPFGPVS